MTVALAHLPRVTPDFSGLTITGDSVFVTQASLPSTGLATAVSLGKRRLILEAGANWTDNLHIPAGFSDWLEVVGENGAPPEGTRITPNEAVNTYDYPTITAPSGYAAVSFGAGARRVKLHGFGVTCTASSPGLQNVPLIDTLPSSVTQISHLPHSIVMRHLWVRGTAAPTSRRLGVRTHATYSALLDSWVDHLNYGGRDYSQQSQAVGGYSFLGQLLIENNFLWRATEAWGFGGAGTQAYLRNEQLQISDVTIRRNHIYMPLSLKSVEGCANSGESKQTRRLLVEANIHENVNTDLQNGYAGPCGLSANQQGNDGPHVQLCDVTARYNWYKNHNSGFSLQSGDGYDNQPSVAARRANINNNFFTGMGTSQTLSPESLGFNRIWTIDGVADVSFKNNLAIIESGSFVVVSGPQVRQEIENNIVGVVNAGGYFLLANSGADQDSWNEINTDGSSTFRGNACLIPAADAGQMINSGTNQMRHTLAAMGFVDSSKILANDVKYAQLGALALHASSDLLGTAYGGGDPGPNWTTVLSQLSGVEAAQSDLDDMEP